MIRTLYNPAAGIAYLLWLRMRWVMAGIFIYLAVLAVSVQLFPLAAIGTLALSAVVAHLLTVFTFGPVDLGVRGSGFPKNMMVLPMRTYSLVCWPMIYGAGTMAVLWILVATLILAPAEVRVPVLWPAALGAAATAWLQAIGWSPFPSPFARVPALAVALTPLCLLGSCAGVFLESQAVSISIVLASFAWILAAYFFAVQGLSRARTGSEGDWFRVIVDRLAARLRKRHIATTYRLPRFRSAVTAQLWHECRCNAIAFPVMLSFVGMPLIVLILPTTIDDNPGKNLMFSSHVVSPSMLGLALLVFMFLLFSGLYGPSLGKFNIWGKEAMPAFFAIRPMATSRFVLVKAVAAALGALAAWTILLVLISLWAIVEASPLNSNDSLVRAGFAAASPRVFAVFIAALIGLLAISWREVVNGMWVTLTGRKWLAVVLGMLSMAIFALMGISGWWVYEHPELQPRLRTLAPWLVGIFLGAKICVAAWAIMALHKQRLVPSHTLRNWLGGWIVAGIILCAILSLLVPPTPMLAAGILLMLPLTRLAAAPLALHWNRHR